MATPSAPHGERPWLRTQRDKKMGIRAVDTRFELPYDFPPNPELVFIAATPTIKATIEQFEKLSKWTHYDKREITIHVSHLPSRDELDGFNRMKIGDGTAALGVTRAKPVVVLFARIWFVGELDQVNLDEQAEFSRLLGDMPADWKEAE